MLSRLLPRETSFFQMFTQQAENVYAGAVALVEMLENFNNPVASVEKIESYEHIGDTITHGVMTRLNQIFITPFDREDIHELASKIDDVIDLIDAVSSRLITYRVQTIRPGVVDLARTVRDASAEIVAAVRVLDKGDHILEDRKSVV